MAQSSYLQEIDGKDLRDVVLIRTSTDACLRGYYRQTGQKVAIKLLKDSKWIDRLKKVEMGQLVSEQVLIPLGVYKTGSTVGLVWDWMTKGSLDSALYETNLFSENSVALRLRILLDVAKGLACLHAVPMPHGALKATNVLLDQQCHAKLCDWGQQLGMHLTSNSFNGSGPCFRDLAYMSPEALQGAISSVESDIYSFGILLWETLNRKRPCTGIDQLQALLLSAQGMLEFGRGVNLLPTVTPQNHALTQLMIRCLSSEPKERPSAEECTMVLRTALATFDPQSITEAVIHMKECKETKLISHNTLSYWELPIELNNLEHYSACKSSKNWNSKVIPRDQMQSMSPSQIPTLDAKAKVSLPMALRSCPQVGCFRDNGKFSVQSSNSCCNPGLTYTTGVAQRQNPKSLRSPPVSPTAILPSTLRHNAGNNGACPKSAGRSCCRLLQERRETIVRCMTEGRLNNLLDVLRARQAVTRETYEVITAALTLTARTRCLLDTCACLGENVAVLVATTLGLVSTENIPIAPKWQAG